MLLSSFFPECKSLFSKDMTKARASQDESIELTDMGSHSSPGEDDMIAESIFRKVVDDTSLRYEVEGILSSHGISFEEVAFEMGGESCDKNTVYVRVKGITSPVPHLTWFESEGEIAEVFLKKDLGTFKIDMKPDMLARSVEPVEPVKRVKKKTSASDLVLFRLF